VQPKQSLKDQTVMKKSLCSVAFFVSVALTFTLQAAPAEIYLVRHAEKQPSADKDPKLSRCGLAQAEAMGKLVPATVSMIYHSGYQRTLETAQQIALSQKDATLLPYQAGDLAGIAAKIQQQDQAVLVVGHSNTVPELIQILSQLPPPQISEQDYGVVYLLKQQPQGYQLNSFRIELPKACAIQANEPQQ
jgi:phosphohistidine phosphatase SixA